METRTGLIEELIEELKTDGEGFSVCCICGMPYIPKRKDQRTCGSAKCKEANHKLANKRYRENMPEWRKEKERINSRQRMRRKRAIEHMIARDTLQGIKNYQRNANIFNDDDISDRSNPNEVF